MKVHITPQSAAPVSTPSSDGGARSRVGLMVIIMMMVHMVPYMVIKTMKINYRYIKLNPPKDAAQNVPKTSYAAIKPDLISKVEPRDHHQHCQHCQHRLKPHQQGRRGREPWALQKDSGNRFRRSLRSPHHSHS